MHGGAEGCLARRRPATAPRWRQRPATTVEPTNVQFVTDFITDQRPERHIRVRTQEFYL
jgi:hypothetical protein